MNDCRVDPEKEHKEKKREMERKKLKTAVKRASAFVITLAKAQELSS